MNQFFYTFLLAYWQYPWLRWLVVLAGITLLIAVW
jgi:hypothetical protein